MTQLNVEERTLEFYRLLTADFMCVVNEWLADDFQWINHLPERIPFGGVYQGAMGLGQYGQELASAIELKPLEVDEIIVQGLTAVVIGVEKATRVIPTGKYYDMDWVHVVKYAEDGRLRYVREYNQYEGMLAAFTE
ncbi:MAG: hypothetical protein HOI95_26820 [Chromatiales bacterium]|jgi:ketosteroid isomerase-like protein|nr:hypothetical protein [Chromatiales bacterium]